MDAWAFGGLQIEMVQPKFVGDTLRLGTLLRLVSLFLVDVVDFR